MFLVYLALILVSCVCVPLFAYYLSFYNCKPLFVFYQMYTIIVKPSHNFFFYKVIFGCINIFVSLLLLYMYEERTARGPLYEHISVATLDLCVPFIIFCGRIHIAPSSHVLNYTGCDFCF